MKPGYELDELVAEKVMGWTKVKPEEPPRFGYRSDTGYWVSDHNHSSGEYLPKYSTDVAAAWKVVLKLKKWKFTLTWEYNFATNEPYATAIFDPVLVDEHNQLFVTATTAPHAICLAALRAVGVDI